MQTFDAGMHYCLGATLPGSNSRSPDCDDAAHAARPTNRTDPVEIADRTVGASHAAHRIRRRAKALANRHHYQALAMFPCWLIQLCMAIPAATATLMLRVEPN